MADTENDVILDAGIALAEPRQPLPNLLTYVLPPGTQVQQVDVQRHTPGPRRASGDVTVYDTNAFCDYVSTHTTVAEVWADSPNFGLLAVLNPHRENEPAWEDWRVSLRLKATKAWQAWAEHDRQMMFQPAFAEHLEDNLADIAEPSAGEMLELVQTFQAKTKVSFESGHLLASGERALEYREETQAAAGKKGSITVPAMFTLGLAPFEGSEHYKVTARFRYRITEGQLFMGYILNRPDEVQRAAFNDVIQGVEAVLPYPIWQGQPAPAARSTR